MELSGKRILVPGTGGLIGPHPCGRLLRRPLECAGINGFKRGLARTGPWFPNPDTLRRCKPARCNL